MIMNSPENPPAFPVAEVRIDGCGITEGYPGMTLRDWFAGQALAGLMANATHADDGAPKYAYFLADRMLAERSKA